MSGFPFSPGGYRSAGPESIHLDGHTPPPCHSLTDPGDFGDLFDWDLFLYSDSPSDVTTKSDGSSDGSSVTTGSSALTYGTSIAPPSSPGRDLDFTGQQHQQPVMASAGDVRPSSDLWPQLQNMPQPPRERTIKDLPSPGGGPTRTLMNPLQTAEIRKKGACLSCKIKKVQCDLAPACQECAKICAKLDSDSASDMCIRKEPSKIIGAQFNRWAWLPSQSPFPRQDQSQYRSHDIFVSFSEEVTSQPLKVSIDLYNTQTPNGGVVPVCGLSLTRDMKGIGEDIMNWSESELLSEKPESFEGHIESLFRKFVRHEVLDRLMSLGQDGQVGTQLRSQRSLMHSVLKMSCAWRVWAAEILYFRSYEHRAKATPMHLKLEAVQGQLKGCAESLLKAAEKEALDAIDSYLEPRHLQPDKNSELWPTMNVAMWLTLMQLILLYRKTMSISITSQQNHFIPVSVGMVSEKRHQFLQTTTELLKSLVVIYATHFRTRKALESLRDANVSVFASSNELHEDFRLTWGKRRQFYDKIKEQILLSDADKLIIDHIAVKEEKVFQRGSPSSKKKKQ